MERLDKFAFAESKLGEPDAHYGYYFNATYEKRLQDLITLIEFSFQQPDFVNMKLDSSVYKAYKRNGTTQ